MINRILYIFLIILTLASGRLSAQKSVSFQECIQAAAVNNARYRNIALEQEISDKRTANINAAYLPSMELSGRASWQSDVTQINADLPVPGIEFPVPSKDQYRITLDVKQVIYDAGKTSGARKMEQTGKELALNKVWLDLDKEKEFVKELFFQCLFLQENIRISNTAIERLEQQLITLDAGMKGGIILPSDIDLVRTEILQLGSELEILQSSCKGAFLMLSGKTGLDLQSTDSLVLTGFESEFETAEIKRKELLQLELSKKLKQNSEELSGAKRLPVAYAFAQGGYGQPGLNMLSEGFDPWFIAGIGFTWNLWDWNQVKREKEIFRLQAYSLENEKEELESAIVNALAAQALLINSIINGIDSQEKVVELRRNISDNYRKRLEGGTIRTIDLVNALNEERLAELRLNAQKIKLQKAIADYLAISGNL